MTDKVNPSPNRLTLPYATAGAIALGGGSVDGWIVSASDPTDIASKDTAINTANLNQFEQTSSGSSLDVTIDPGEAFVYGSWLVTETSRTVTLDASTNEQTVALSWDETTGDTILVDLESNLSKPLIPLYDFDTDGTGVTNVTDRRQIGKKMEAERIESGDATSIDFDVNGTLVQTLSDTGDVSIPNGNLSIATDQSVVDGSNQSRLELNSSQTRLRDQNNNPILQGGDASSVRLFASNGLPLDLFDREGGFSALKYTTSANAPGSLSLDNANLNTTGNDISLQDSGRISFGSSADMEVYYDQDADKIVWVQPSVSGRMGLDRDTGDLEINGELTENASL